MVPLKTPPAKQEKYVSKNVNPAAGPPKGVNKNFTMDSKKKVL